MCRSIKPLFNYDPPVDDDDIRSAALQFVRKISGFTRPSKANEHAFEMAVDQITAISTELLRQLETKAAPRNREKEIAEKRQERARRYTETPAASS